MTAEFSVEDPEYFVGSFTHTRSLIYSPHLKMTPYDCDPEASSNWNSARAIGSPNDHVPLLRVEGLAMGNDLFDRGPSEGIGFLRVR